MALSSMLKQKLTEIPGVDSVVLLSDNENEVEVVIEGGGDDKAIANVIFACLPAPYKPVGSVEVALSEELTVCFSRSSASKTLLKSVMLGTDSAYDSVGIHFDDKSFVTTFVANRENTQSIPDNALHVALKLRQLASSIEEYYRFTPQGKK